MTLMFIIVCVGVISAMIIIWWRGTQFVNVKVIKGTNNDSAAVSHFITLVRSAQDEILIHDDGDSKASLYNDDDAIKAIRERLTNGVEVRWLIQ